MKHETMYKRLGEKFDKGNYTFCCDNGNVYFCNKDNTVLYMLPNSLVLSAAWENTKTDHRLSAYWENHISTGKHILAEDIETKRYQTISGKEITAKKITNKNGISAYVNKRLLSGFPENTTFYVQDGKSPVICGIWDDKIGVLYPFAMVMPFLGNCLKEME